MLNSGKKVINIVIKQLRTKNPQPKAGGGQAYQ